MAAPCPFELVYDALWEIVEGYKPLTDLVRLGNRIKFSADGASRGPIKQEVSEIDFPELRLIVKQSTPHAQRTSNHSTIGKQFEWQVAGGSQLYDDALFKVEWALFRALAGWETVLDALRWHGERFVIHCRQAMPAMTAIDQLDLDRGIRSWSTLWTAEVDMWFFTADMLIDAFALVSSVVAAGPVAVWTFDRNLVHTPTETGLLATLDSTGTLTAPVVTAHPGPGEDQVQATYASDLRAAGAWAIQSKLSNIAGTDGAAVYGTQSGNMT